MPALLLCLPPWSLFWSPYSHILVFPATSEWGINADKYYCKEEMAKYSLHHLYALVGEWFFISYIICYFSMWQFCKIRRKIRELKSLPFVLPVASTCKHRHRVIVVHFLAWEAWSGLRCIWMSSCETCLDPVLRYSTQLYPCFLPVFLPLSLIFWALTQPCSFNLIPQTSPLLYSAFFSVIGPSI